MVSTVRATTKTTHMANIKKDPKNFRKHTARGSELVKQSIKRNGFGRSILIDADGVIIAGNDTYEQARKEGLEVQVIKTDGKKIIALQRVDLKENDPRRLELALADNATAEQSFNMWDYENLVEVKELATLYDVEIPAWLFDEKELKEQTDLSGEVGITYRVEIECEDEKHQEQIYEKLSKQGLVCRILTL